MAEDEDKSDTSESEAVSALEYLEAQLALASKIFPDDKLHGAVEALDAVIGFLQTDDIKHRSPLIHLLAGLIDLSNGRAVEWLEPGGKGTNRTFSSERAFRASIVGTLNFLVHSGVDDNSALKMLAKSIRREPKTIRKWKERLTDYESALGDPMRISIIVENKLLEILQNEGRKEALRRALEVASSASRELPDKCSER